MKDDPDDTLTTIEAKVLCMRYGIDNIDESNNINKLRKYQSSKEESETSLRDMADKLGKDKVTLKVTEINALRKLKIQV